MIFKSIQNDLKSFWMKEFFLISSLFKGFTVESTVVVRHKVLGLLVTLILVNNIAFPKWARAADGMMPTLPILVSDDDDEDALDGSNQGQNQDSKDKKKNKDKNRNNNNNDIDPSAPDRRQPKTSKVRPSNNNNKGYVVNAGMDVADVDEEFNCPLFENKAYETILDSLDKLNAAIIKAKECPNSPSISSVTDSTKKIQDAVTALKPYFDHPEKAYANTSNIEDAIRNAVSGVDVITQSLANPAFRESACGKAVTQTGGAMNALTNIVNALGPYALLGLSVAPGLSMAVKGTALTLVAGTTAFKEYSELVSSRKLDMGNLDDWKAVVLNTCAYTRVTKKLQYIEDYESGLLSALDNTKVENKTEQILPAEVRQSTINFQKKYGQRQDHLGQLIALSLQDRAKLSKIAKTIDEGKVKLQSIDTQIGDDRNDQEVMCSFGTRLANQAKDPKIFPKALMDSIEPLYAFKNVVDPDNYVGLNETFKRLVTVLQGFNDRSLNTNNAVQQCASKTRSLLDILNRTVIAYEQALKNVDAAREAELSKNSDYRKWKEEYQNLVTQRKMGIQLYSVMKNIVNSPSVLKTYLSQRHAILKAALFNPIPGAGKIPVVTNGKPPVLDWLEATLAWHKNELALFDEYLKYLRVNLYNIKSRQLNGNKATPITDPKMLGQAYRGADDYSLFNVKNFNLNDPVQQNEHKLTCQTLRNAWKEWARAVNNMDSVGQFCEMIDSSLDINVDTRIIKFCRGSLEAINYVTKPEPSKVGIAISQVLTPNPALGNKSLEQMAMTVLNAMQSMQCDKPSAN
jgi:hypothetical protein